jgi:hypothetical protein
LNFLDAQIFDIIKFLDLSNNLIRFRKLNSTKELHPYASHVTIWCGGKDGSRKVGGCEFESLRIRICIFHMKNPVVSTWMKIFFSASIYVFTQFLKKVTTSSLWLQRVVITISTISFERVSDVGSTTLSLSLFM